MVVSLGTILVGVDVVGRAGVDGNVAWAGVVVGLVGDSGVGVWDGVDGAGSGVTGTIIGGAGASVVLGSVGSGLGMVAMSSKIDLRAVGVFAGVNLLRNCLFRWVRRPEPSIRTWYWWNCLTSTIVPVRSHLVG